MSLVALFMLSAPATMLIAVLTFFFAAKWLAHFWLLFSALPFLFGTTVAYPGLGSHLASGGTTGSSYTNIAQLKNIKFAGIKGKFDTITNLDSPAGGGSATAVFEEYLKTLVDGDSVTFDFVMNPADPTTQALLANLQLAGQTALYFWKISLTNGSVLVFQGYASDFKIDVSYDKAIIGSGGIKIVGPVTPTW